MPNAALFVSPGPLVDGSGNPYAGSKLNFYTTGTSSRLNTYSDSGLTSANTNPVVADINGKFGPIYLFANTSYKVVFTTSADVTIWTWDPVQGIPISATPSVGLLRSYLAGLQKTSRTNTTITFSGGACADSTNALAMSVAAGTIDCGTVGLNGLDTGALANITVYHAYAIGKVDGTTALLASTSASSPALPSGYTLFRRLGSFVTNTSAQIVDFVQDGDYIQWLIPVNCTNATNPGTSAVTRTLASVSASIPAVPTGVNVIAVVQGVISSNPSGSIASGYLSDLATTDTAVGVTNSNFGIQGTVGSTFTGTGLVPVRTNTSGQIRSRLSNSAADTALNLNVQGYYDSRGRNA